MKGTEKCSKSVKVTKLTFKEITNNFNKNPKQQTEIIILDSVGRKNNSIISPTFYTKFLCKQIPKAQKRLMADGICVLLGFAHIKNLRKMLVKSTPVILFFLERNNYIVGPSSKYFERNRKKPFKRLFSLPL